MNCRHCQTPLRHVFLDLGFAPPSNAYLTEADLSRPEVYYPLKLYVCDHCWLVQTEDYARADELFRADYAYFSSHLVHLAGPRRPLRRHDPARGLTLSRNSLVIEVAANDGYLLQELRRRRHPLSRHRAHGRHRRRGRGAGHPGAAGILRRRPGPTRWPTRAGRPI